ncbi:vesicle transport protein SFT2B-like [Daphnia carinata]|uniref:vesicle transport protein SFT2B-like n=1 Tax=Daphnia carinata TaxID=120202 RepID=UPI00257D2C1C|nr:vesicle transport protein SFT2B-like [Daphnia carinata]
MMDKLRRALSGNDGEDEERGFVAQVVESSSLGWGTRVKGFVACFVIGIILSVIGSICLFFGSRGLVAFSVFYTTGNIIALVSTCFLMGPLNQCKKMFSPTRVVATVLVFVCLILTLLSAFLWKKSGLALLFCIIQFLAMTWYSLSYIPYARDVVKKTVSACMG